MTMHREEEKLDGRRTRTNGNSRAPGPTFTHGRCIAAINRAPELLGDPPSAKGYQWWRTQQIEDEPTAACGLPAYAASGGRSAAGTSLWAPPPMQQNE